MATARMSGLVSARAASSQVVSTVPAKGAARRRTQVVETTGLAAVASAKVRAGPARATVRAPSVKLATQAPAASVTTVRAGSLWRVRVYAGEAAAGWLAMPASASIARS